jgi:hypothetical protein
MDARIRKKMEIKTYCCPVLKTRDKGYSQNEIEAAKGGVLIILHANEFSPKGDYAGRNCIANLKVNSDSTSVRHNFCANAVKVDVCVT